jgi:hypothetical protein
VATIDLAHTSLRPLGGGRPTVRLDATAPASFEFRCPGFIATGTMRLRGASGEALGGWTLGYVQLKFIGTNYARYQGARDRDGSILVTGSNQIVCRDTDEASPAVWYDPVSWGIHGARGTRVLAAGTTIPASGFLDVVAGFGDAPHRSWPTVHSNTAIPSRPDNFLHHVDIALHFCTVLTARDPANNFHLLKHFYWNVRWELMFTRSAAGVIAPGQVIHQELNIQRTVHSGASNDRRFQHRELAMIIPISNTVSRQPNRVHCSRDWSQI